MLEIADEFNGWRLLERSVWFYLRKLLEIGKVHQSTVSMMKLLNIEGVRDMEAYIVWIFQQKAIKDVILCAFFVVS